MNLKERLRTRALELGFADAGFTTAEPLDLYIQEIDSRPHMYNWVMTEAFNTRRGATLAGKHPWARSVLVVLRNYHRRRFPPALTGRIGRCYQVDERQEPGEELRRLQDLFDFLKVEKVRFLLDGEVPARMCAARAGVATYGKNCFVYARRAMRGASWLESLPMLLDAEIEPDEPSIELGCPDWCKNACLAACPTGALYSPKKMNPFKCIAYQSYYGPGITPLELRAPMGTWVYGCDRCQEVCPRNQAWMNQDLPANPALEARAGDFTLETLLAMNQEHHATRVWPLTFYISRKNTGQLQMNAARALGNLGDPDHVPALAKSLSENPDERVRGMAAWALGRLGGPRARAALETARSGADGLAAEEAARALEMLV
jgi:epoxyqueuosine reductase